MRERELRSRLDLPASDPAQSARLTARGAARRLRIGLAYAGLPLKRGIIPGTQAVPGSMWCVDPAVLDSKDLRETRSPPVMHPGRRISCVRSCSPVRPAAVHRTSRYRQTEAGTPQRCGVAVRFVSPVAFEQILELTVSRQYRLNVSFQAAVL